MKFVRTEAGRRQLLVANLDAFAVGAAVQFGLHCQTGTGLGRRDQLDNDLVTSEGPSPPVIAEKTRCSIRFHFDVPGGKWQTVIVSPVSSARPANSVFHNRPR